ncbi:MAG TPA: L,D-transpeptidase [Rhizobiales bacterium]|nr:L,D-transpeptidase [Hyphomicrobiales bacterium]
MMRKPVRCALFAFVALFPALARADVLAHIDLSEQRLYLYVDGDKKYTWKISAGKKKGWTRTGTFRPYFLSRHHRSSLFRGAPMPYAVFYDRDWAIHGTNAIKRLGRPASHGCVRLHPKNAAVFFNLVLKQGKKNTVVWITD